EAKPSKKRICALKIFYLFFAYYLQFSLLSSFIHKITIKHLIHLNTYVIGSYMEHRLGEKQIKRTAIVLRSEQVMFSCVMGCAVRLPAEHSIHSDHFNFEYGTATITCQIKSTCLTPTHVAITASGVSESVTSFQPIRNRDAPTTFQYNFTICISAMFDYKSVLNLVQSMEMFRLLGAQRVVIYKTNCDSNTQKVLDYYEKIGFVEIIPWTIKKHINVSHGWEINKSPGQLHYFGQIPALNDCVYRYMYQSRYVALHDMDELILPIKVKTWTELLLQLEDMYRPAAHLNYEQDKWKNIQGVNILNYINRVPNPPNYFSNFKIVVNPRLVLKATVHGLLDSVNGKPLVWVSNSIARMYHFKHFTYPPNTKLVRDDHLWDYANDLIPAVSKVLQASGLIEA
uniref:Glycosyltransferase family 92 protein n=1 Tax=Cyprinus carpio TaxID=7962 RepID=A0A8C2E982_CYPCA